MGHHCFFLFGSNSQTWVRQQLLEIIVFRMRASEQMDRACIFRCSDSSDELWHCLVSIVLWLFWHRCFASFNTRFVSGHRLCVTDPIAHKWKTLTVMCHITSVSMTTSV